MRAMFIVAVLAFATLAGCADPAPTGTDEPDGFKDVKVEVDEQHGVILGVVVDQAIVPIADVKVSTDVGGKTIEKTTDAQGRFVFDRVPEGTYFLTSEKLGYEASQISATVVAGVKDPAVLKIQMAATFSGTPYMVPFQFTGFIACSYSYSGGVGINAPCITDYTSIGYPGGAAPILREIQGDSRDWLTEVNPGWKSHVTEMVWEASAQGTSDRLGVTISFEGRTASHWYSSDGGPSPLLSRLDQGTTHPTNQGDPAQVPEEGLPNLLSFVGVRRPDGEILALAVEQEFESFTHTFYNLGAPEGWSFIAGDGNPF